ncbi:MAG: D-alanine--D-alanine ligase [Candidatus Kapabacteria bacterium]|nr:D-alanine--D-alanine ligase [Candidatus Kapabacteria bacterium]MDW8011900.1 D-alanine--D-alanine ligase [Bacteroidota bacterium]
MRVAVLLGGISPERNISLLSGRWVTAALRERGHEVLPLDPARGAHALLSDAELENLSSHLPSEEELRAFSPWALAECISSPLLDDVDVVFPVLHGPYGEDGRLQVLLELRGIPYVGSTSTASAVAADKHLAKLLFVAAGIPTPRWIALAPEQLQQPGILEDIRSELGAHLVVKPNDQGSTVGTTFLHDPTEEELEAALQHAARYSDLVIVERYIEGRELTVAILGEEALPIVEILPSSGVYDYEHKYTPGKTGYICPAELPEDIAEFTQNLALSAHRIIGCRHFSRVDFRLDADGQLFCLELNTIPGMTSMSLVPRAAQAAGIEFPELCERLVQMALEDSRR